MVSFWRIVNEVIKESDILLEVVDSRLIEETRNPEIESKIFNAEKDLIIVINKCDLVSKRYIEDYINQFEKDNADPKRKAFAVPVSAKERLGTTILRKAIMRTAKARGKGKIIVGVLGYPNTGKSSVINSLKGKHSAKASPSAGYTKGKQLVRVSRKVFLIDTPGVMPFRENDEVKLAIIGSKNPGEIKDPETIAEKIISFSGEAALKDAYGESILDGSTVSEKLRCIAVRLGKIKKGNIPDTETAARIIIKDWQRGKISIKG